MDSNAYFKPVGSRQPLAVLGSDPEIGVLKRVLSERVIKRFAHLTGREVTFAPLNLPELQEAEDPTPNPAHPACAEFAHTAYCTESWQLHLAELARQPSADWHACDHGMLCAVVPVVCNGQCRGVCKLVCPASVGIDTFQSHAELLDLLVRDFIDGVAEEPMHLRADLDNDATKRRSSARCADRQSTHPTMHPKVDQAVRYIAQHFLDHDLKVSHIAATLGIHADYLAHLFAQQIGERMSHYITARRIERSQSLLATTDWRIKRVALESGFAHPNWFHHVFHLHVGLTPTEYRQRVRAHTELASGVSA